MTDELQNEILSGTVEAVKYRNEQNGYTVLEIGCDEGLITAVGIFADLSVGENVKLSGTWTYHATFGRQFKVDSYERSMPHTTEQLYNYLAAGAVKGIGPATAEKIITAFGENAFDVLENEPDRLATIKGISIDKARNMSAEYRKQFALRNIMMSLESYSMTPNECVKAYQLFGSRAVERVLENPFELCASGSGISFERAEVIAAGLPNPPSDNYRVKAGVEHIITHNLYNDGHTCLPRNKLIKIGANYLDVAEDTVDILLDELIKENKLVSKRYKGKEYVFRTDAYNDEKSISDRIKVFLKFPPPQRTTLFEEIEKVEKQLGIKYAENQQEAIQTAVNKGMLILTGGPGTGKTTTLNGIIKLFENEDLDIALCAPTGRAAKRMSELTGREARTIHRLLEVEFDEYDRQSFKRNLRNPLDCEVLVVDELSMVDINLFASLLAALPFGCRLIMVGDSDQLPPVGAGNVLADLIGSKLLPVVELNEVFRQSMNSLIVTNAHRIVRGEDIVLDRKDSDFFMMERFSAHAAAQTVCDLYTQRLPKAYGYSPFTDIQVICPSKKGEAGTVQLNSVLQSLVNPPDKGKNEITVGFRMFREGDKVMQIKNDYEIQWEKDDELGEGVFNGDIGIIKQIDRNGEFAVISFDDGREASYFKDQLLEVELAYAVTVHKSQGSEFPCVIMPVVSVIPQLKYRNLLYTAVTRARENLVLVGSPDELREMALNDKKARRYSMLKAMLLDELE
jgi:exodeoxyribonuclease V alpha subunit